jgi:erythromycin esterase
MDFEDMQPLKRIVGDARIVALGEATHGTREFFQLKHRMIEFLASQMSFTIFSIEASMPEAYRLNDFVLNGNGDPKQLLKGMYFWTWNTEEVLDMILWMREFNRLGKGHIEFTGFDMQFPTVAMDIVRRFVIAEDRTYDMSLWPIYQDVSHFEKETRDKPPGSDRQLPMNRAITNELLTQRCKEVLKHLENNRATYLLAGANPAATDWAIQNARLVVQYMQLKTSEKSRDESMAENVKWIADHSPGAKLVLWAHNGHVSHSGYGKISSMGGYLRGMFGHDMVNFGLAFNEGSFRRSKWAKDCDNLLLGLRRRVAWTAHWAVSAYPFWPWTCVRH